MNAPKTRSKNKTRKAVIVASSQAPSFMADPLSQFVGMFKKAANLLGAKRIGMLYIGLAARQEKQEISAKKRKRARYLGKKLVSDRAMKPDR